MNRKLIFTLLMLCVFWGCKKDNKEQYIKMIEGTWYGSVFDRLPALTNDISINTFDGNGLIQSTFVGTEGKNSSPITAEGNYRFKGDLMTIELSYRYADSLYNETTVYEICSLNDNFMEVKLIEMKGGARKSTPAKSIVFKRTTSDNANAQNILGWWLIKTIDSIDVNFVACYKENGLYDFYTLNLDGKYLIKDKDSCFYNVTDELLSTWWLRENEGFVDNWIIESLEPGIGMSLMARRKTGDGFEYQSTANAIPIKGIDENGKIID